MEIRQSQVDAFSARVFEGNKTAGYPEKTRLGGRELNTEAAISFIAAAIAF